MDVLLKMRSCAGNDSNGRIHSCASDIVGIEPVNIKRQTAHFPYAYFGVLLPLYFLYAFAGNSALERPTMPAEV